jgi:hypothetical protein
MVEMMEIQPVVLTGCHVRLEPMTEAHIPALAEIGLNQPFWHFMLYGEMHTQADMSSWVMDILARAETGADLPFVAVQLPSLRGG